MFFCASAFNGDLSKWDTHNVKNAKEMFAKSSFNGDVRKWDISSMQNMRWMFAYSPFNRDISNWKIPDGCKTQYMFDECIIPLDFLPSPSHRITESFDIDDFGEAIEPVRTEKKRVEKFSKQHGMLEHIISTHPNARYFGDCSDNELSLLCDLLDNNADIDDDTKTLFWKKCSIVEDFIRVSCIVYKAKKGQKLNDKDVRFMLMGDPFGDEFPNVLNRTNRFYACYKVKDGAELKSLIDAVAKTEYLGGDSCNLNWIDTSAVTSMQGLFCNYEIDDEELVVIDEDSSVAHVDANISLWNVSNVKDMSYMFMGTYGTFEQTDFSEWDVSNVEDMSFMFCEGNFCSDISSWDVSHVRNMRGMFSSSDINCDISEWDVSNVEDMSYMFKYNTVFGQDGAFDGDISGWNVSNVKNMNSMFSNSYYDGDISDWDVSEVVDMGHMFFASCFDSDISEWDIRNVKNMDHMFAISAFKGDLSRWDISAGTDMTMMFNDTEIGERQRPARYNENLRRYRYGY